MQQEGVLNYHDACALIGLAFLKDYGLEADEVPGSSPYQTLLSSKRTEYQKVNPLRGLIGLYLDYNIGEVYKGITIDDWLSMDIVYREMLLEESLSFDERKQAAIKAAEEEAKKRNNTS